MRERCYVSGTKDHRAVQSGNEPAYSSPSFVSPNGDIAWGATGLTKRELLAAMAMQAFCKPLEGDAPPDEWTFDAIAVGAVRAADALLKELAK